MTKEAFSEILPSLPQTPGIYQYFDAAGKVSYVGQAKNLKKRISSYFYKEADRYKTKRLVEEIREIRFTVVDSEQDAFLLENSLIKQYQPRYNMALKDDKTYPHLVIKNEAFPRIFLTRRVLRDGSEYLGPFTSVDQVKALLELIKQTLPFRTCNLNLSDKQIQKGKYKPCLEYHIGNCKAPCAGLQSTTDYDWQVQQVREIFKGKLGEITRHYKQEMMQHASRMEFEQAELIKKRLEFIRHYQSRSVVVSSKLDDLDVCSILSADAIAIVNYMVVVQGSIIHTLTRTVEKKLDETEEEILAFAIGQMRTQFGSSSREIVLPLSLEGLEPLKVTVPRGGDKKKLLELSVQNAEWGLKEYRRQKALHLESPDESAQLQMLEQLQKDLKLKVLPVHIECFDNSNFQGAFPVAAMVCFRNGMADKKSYRHFHIKTVEGINDFASMKEIVYRRYKRLLDEKHEIPQLIIIDGGKGQLSSALESIDALHLRGKVTVVGLAKNIEEIFYPGDSASLKLPYDSSSLLFLRRVRDEVHRFGITFHRKTRSKGTIKNELTNIQGIGEATALLLLKKFKSVRGVKAASLDEIAEVVGMKKAEWICKQWS
jgi:excinuclease ABC subunit C